MLRWLIRHRRALMTAVAVTAGGITYGFYANRFPGSRAEGGPVWNPWKVQVYRWLPLRPLSRVWGKVNSYELPPMLRRPILGFYVRWYKCNLNEAEQSDLRSYVSLQDFFCRSVRAELRPISQVPVVAPGDGVVQWCGPLEQNRLVQVKGISYPLDEFFGRPELTDVDLSTAKLPSLYSCIIYLAPGDYHGFHSPADWQVSLRRHISGSLLSVGQRISRRVNNLYCLNERVHLVGRWRYGFFSLCAVGATNVGSIRLAFEDDFQTNRRDQPLGCVSDCPYDPAHQQCKGDKLGVFKLGSSIVLIFEAPADFRFTVATGDRVKYGQQLGHVSDQP